MRLVDFVCGFCGRAYHDIPERHGVDAAPKCCGHRATRRPAAPRLNNVKRYGQFAFGREMTAREVDAQLKKEGSWVASESERRIIRDMADGNVDPVIVKAPPDDQKLRKAAQKAMRLMKDRGQL